jgi:chromosome segregation ATPase
VGKVDAKKRRNLPKSLDVHNGQVQGVIMSAIKDLYDLGKELKESISDRKTLALVMPIIDKVHEAERENFQMEKSQFELERKHHEEVEKLKTDHAQIISELHSKISQLESQLEEKSK